MAQKGVSGLAAKARDGGSGKRLCHVLCRSGFFGRARLSAFGRGNPTSRFAAACYIACCPRRGVGVGFKRETSNGVTPVRTMIMG